MVVHRYFIGLFLTKVSRPIGEEFYIFCEDKHWKCSQIWWSGINKCWQPIPFKLSIRKFNGTIIQVLLSACARFLENMRRLFFCLLIAIGDMGSFALLTKTTPIFARNKYYGRLIFTCRWCERVSNYELDTQKPVEVNFSGTASKSRKAINNWVPFNRV